jgi:hypothetical protein
MKILSAIMVCLGALMTVLSLIDGEYQTAIWSVNTAIWAGIANSLIDD